MFIFCGSEVIFLKQDTSVIIMHDEFGDLTFEICGYVMVFEQDAVFQGLVLTLDFILGLWMIWYVAYIFDALPPQPFGNGRPRCNTIRYLKAGEAYVELWPRCSRRLRG